MPSLTKGLAGNYQASHLRKYFLPSLVAAATPSYEVTL